MTAKNAQPYLPGMTQVESLDLLSARLQALSTLLDQQSYLAMSLLEIDHGPGAMKEQVRMAMMRVSVRRLIQDINRQVQALRRA